MEPVFSRMSDGMLRLGNTEWASKICKDKKGAQQKISSSPQEVLDNAIAEVKRLGLDVHNQKTLLGLHRIQFGQFKGQSFLWMLNNCLGYSAYIVESLSRETAVDTNLSRNKFKFRVSTVFLFFVN